MPQLRESLFRLGNFTLSSGRTSRWKIDCDALTVEEIDMLADIVQVVAGSFMRVEGVPQGGLRLAEALRPRCAAAGRLLYLLVDDVLTTGNSMNRLRSRVVDSGACEEEAIRGIVLFARGPCPPWVKAVFQMPVEVWGL